MSAMVDVPVNPLAMFAVTRRSGCRELTIEST
jgi:hypothetical protein